MQKHQKLSTVLFILCTTFSCVYSTCTTNNSTFPNCGEHGVCVNDECVCNFAWTNKIENGVMEFCGLSYSQILGGWLIFEWTVITFGYFIFIPLTAIIIYQLSKDHKIALRSSATIGKTDKTALFTFLCLFGLAVVRTLGTIEEAIYLSLNTTSYYIVFPNYIGFCLEFCAVSFMIRFWMRILYTFFSKNRLGTFMTQNNDIKTTTFVIVTNIVIVVWNVLFIILYGIYYYDPVMTSTISSTYNYIFVCAVLCVGSFFIGYGIVVTYKVKKLQNIYPDHHEHRAKKIAKMTSLLLGLGLIIICAIVFIMVSTIAVHSSHSVKIFAVNRCIIFLIEIAFFIVFLNVLGKKKLYKAMKFSISETSSSDTEMQ